ncbi:MAG: ABC transporter permease [Ekhidna sp.]
MVRIPKTFYMLTYIKFFLRSFRRNRLFSIVNVLGLTIGFFTSIMIYLYVQDEMSYDQFHQNGDNIYRINQTFIWGEDNPHEFASTGPGVAYAIDQELPAVEQVVRIHTPEMPPITFDVEGELRFFNKEYIFAVDSNFFDVFTFHLEAGDPATALDLPNSVVLKHETAKRFFGNDDPIGKVINIGKGESFIVRGVLEKDLPNSYVGSFDLLISLNSIDRMKRVNDNWMWTMFETFVVVNRDANIESLKAALNQLPEKYAGTTLGWMGYTYEEYIAAGKEWNLFMQPLKDIYLHSRDKYNRIAGVGDFKIVIALISSAVFLIILSCINFINLSTAKFTSKAKDVALRKILGGSQAILIRRFVSDAFLYCCASFFLAFSIAYYTIPYVNQSLGVTLSTEMLSQPFLWLFGIMLIILIAFIAGFYPFLFYSSFNTVSTLKGEMKSGKKGSGIRNGMLVAQYVLSFILIIGTITIYQQLNHFSKADLGFEKENLITIENVHWTTSQQELVEELKAIEGVQGASLCDAVPLLISNGDQFIPDDPEAGSIPLNYALADENYLSLLQAELAIGRYFDPSYQSDTTAIVLNETAAETIGWPVDESIIGKKLKNWSGEYHVIGVVKDFNFWSLHAPIEPFAIFHSDSYAQGDRPLTRVLVKTYGSTDQLQATMDQIEEKWEEFLPNRPFETVSLSHHFESSYQTEEKFGGVLGFFATLTIIIASLGLFGIVVFSVEHKLKEIGVRKVLGASVSNLVIKLSSGYVKLVLIAFAIAAPFGYYFMENWLSDFEYRIDLNPWIFVAALSILLIVSLAISIYHTLKAASLNPAEVLKDE